MTFHKGAILSECDGGCEEVSSIIYVIWGRRSRHASGCASQTYLTHLLRPETGGTFPPASNRRKTITPPEGRRSRHSPLDEQLAMPSPLRIAVIGCGSMGEIHADCLSRIEGVRLHAFCDVDEQRAAALCAKFPGSYATADHERVLRDGEVDAVYVCTHHDTHSLLAIRAAEEHKHVMMEKPLALTILPFGRPGERIHPLPACHDCSDDGCPLAR